MFLKPCICHLHEASHRFSFCQFLSKTTRRNLNTSTAPTNFTPKELLRNELQSHFNWKYMTAEEKGAMVQKYQLKGGVRELNRIVSQLRKEQRRRSNSLHRRMPHDSKSGAAAVVKPLTHHQKEQVLQYVKERNYPAKISREERNVLQQEIGCSHRILLTREIARIYASRNRGHITPHIKRRILKWISQNHRKPTREQREDLRQELNISQQQLNMQLYSLKHGSLDTDASRKREAIRRWMFTHNFRMPTTSEKHQLQREYELSPMQLNSLLHRYCEAYGKITSASKQMVADWLDEHSHRLPTRTERNELIQMTGWNSKQLSMQLYLLRDKQSKDGSTQATTSTPKQVKQTILEWFTEHDWRMPSREERAILQEEIGCTRTQLNNQLHYLRRRHSQNDA